MMARPWEIAAGTRPWEVGEAVYPRTISIFRLATNSSADAAAGPLPYQEPQAKAGVLVWNTPPIFSGIACSIQEETRGQMSTVQLPGSQLVPFFRIFIPVGGLALGSVMAHDYVKDDIGAKYEVSDPYWDSLGYRLFAILSES